MIKPIKYLLAIFITLIVIHSQSVLALATHSWGGFHWARTANPFTLKLGDNLSSNWDPFLATSSLDWSLSTVLDTQIVKGLTQPKNCKPSPGRIEVCNSSYGNNGWLGIASVWASGGHITQSTVKMNDTYFKTAKYNTPAWKNLVLCQEIGHTFGLDHQDEDFNNTSLNTCMDYTSNPTSNQHPNQHDYDYLEQLYAHLDSISTISQTPQVLNPADINHNDRQSWGQLVRQSTDKKTARFEKDLGKGHKVFTFVIWADPDSNTH